MKQYFFLLLIIFIFTSCNKKLQENNFPEGPTTISGTIVQNGTLTPIDHAEVWLTSQSKGSSWSGGAGGGAAPSRYLITDSTGHFSFSFYGSSDSVYGLWVKANPKLYIEGVVNGDDNFYNGQSLKNRLIRVNAKGWVKYVVMNESPKDTVYNFTVGDNWTIYTLYKDTTIYKMIIGGANREIIYGYDKYSLKVHQRDTIYVPAIDTVEYTIKY